MRSATHYYYLYSLAVFAVWQGPLQVQGFLSRQASLSPVSRCPAPASSLFYEPDQPSTGSNNNIIFQSPVLQQVYSEILKYKDEYGHPNIPLGSSAGRQCQTLRRLHIQNKLTPDEMEWLDSLGFTWHSLEEVYKYADFDTLFDRMMDYESKHPESNFQIPKKCKEDPELGAWVTGIRRLGKDGVNPDHERRLEKVGFAWKSNRKCGSKFMEQYRIFTKRVGEEGLEAVMGEEGTKTWIMAQQEALKRGSLSQTRVHYMGNLFGESWTTVGRDTFAP